jgi:hypothetical protein
MRARPIAPMLITTMLITTIMAISALMPTGILAQTAASAPTAEQRMNARFPQPARVGDLIGLPVLDDSARTLGYVREIVRTNKNKIELIVDYRGLFDWRSRPIAVPLEVVGIAGRHISSIDMPRSEYAAAATWRNIDAQPLPADAVIRIALSRH